MSSMSSINYHLIMLKERSTNNFISLSAFIRAELSITRKIQISVLYGIKS